MGRTLKQKLLKRGVNHARSRALKRRQNARIGAFSWKTSSARCTGSSHIQAGTPCQDWAMSKRFDNGDIAISLADGAGSSKYSHYGSSLVATRVSQLISDHFDEAFGNSAKKEVFKQRLIRQLQIDVSELTKLGINLTEDERNHHSLPSRDQQLLVPCKVSDLACTILCIVVRGNRFVAIHVGDGVMGIELTRYGNTILEVLSRPDNGEFANETYFVTSSSAIESARMVTGRINSATRNVTGFILMSDGPESALYNKREAALAPACSKLLAATRALEQDEMSFQLEKTLSGVIAKKTSDDCSLALMSRID